MDQRPFVIHGTNDKIWNSQELIKFLSKNQQQHIELIINPEAICLRSLGIYDLLDCFDFSEVVIYTENPLETHDKYHIKFPKRQPFRWFFHKPMIPQDLHQWTRDKKFLAFYHRPTASRLGFASYLHSHCREESVIHFNYETDIDRIQLYEFDKLASLRQESLGEISRMLPSMPIQAYNNADVDEVMSWYDYSRDAGITLYKNIFVDVVSEAHVIGNTFYPTEKTARPIWLKKPFLMFASKNYLDYLHQMKFLTFNDFWSEQYDGFEGRDRYLMILDIIDSLSKKSINELESMYLDMQHILDHNYNLLLTTGYTTAISPID